MGCLTLDKVLLYCTLVGYCLPSVIADEVLFSARDEFCIVWIISGNDLMENTLLHPHVLIYNCGEIIKTDKNMKPLPETLIVSISNLILTFDM